MALILSWHGSSFVQSLWRDRNTSFLVLLHSEGFAVTNDCQTTFNTFDS